MPTGTCDPATRGDAFNSSTLSRGNGQVTIDVRYGWDGVSTRATGCDGPLVNGTGGAANRWAVQVVNNDTVSWWVHTVGKRGLPHNYEFTPGSTTQFTVQQASNNGYDSISDFAELTLSTSPTAS
jgi:hypothetical protein